MLSFSHLLFLGQTNWGGGGARLSSYVKTITTKKITTQKIKKITLSPGHEADTLHHTQRHAIIIQHIPNANNWVRVGGVETARRAYLSPEIAHRLRRSVRCSPENCQVDLPLRLEGLDMEGQELLEGRRKSGDKKKNRYAVKRLLWYSWVSAAFDMTRYDRINKKGHKRKQKKRGVLYPYPHA